ncbi:MAG: AAA family ATPase [Bryobacterales bacterium]|nr:AAA family ATPase [Bryobacterales bacterium]
MFFLDRSIEVPEIKGALDGVLTSKYFRKKKRSKLLLQYLVDATIDGHAESLTGEIVRTEALGGCSAEALATEKRRLGEYLGKFYELEGAGERLQFMLIPHLYAVDCRIVEAKRTRLVGRAAPFANLQKGWSRVQSGGFAGNLIAGDAGFGKTTLVAEYVESLSRLLSPCLLAAAQSTGATPGTVESYLPIDRAIESAIRKQTLKSGLDVESVLREEAPTWFERVIEGKEERRASRNQLLRFLGAITKRMPVVLILEDLHLADFSALDDIGFLLQAMPARVQVVLTYRPSEMVGVRAMLLQSVRLLPVEIDPLDPLSRPDVAQIIENRFPLNLFPPDFVSAIHHVTAGNPLYLHRLIELLVASGQVRKDGGRLKSSWRVALPFAEFVAGLPGSLNDLLGAVLHDLNAVERRLVLAASLQGEEFDSQILARVLEIDAADVEESLRQIGSKLGIIRFLKSSVNGSSEASVRYRFTHHLYQQAALREFEQMPTWRTRWSLATAKALIDGTATSPHSDIAIAGLLSGAGARSESVPYYGRAAQSFLAALSHYACQRAAMDGLGVATEGKVQDPSNLIALHITLGVSVVCTRGFADPLGEASFAAALEIAESTGANERLPDILYGFWIGRSGQGRFHDSIPLAQRLRQVGTKLKRPLYVSRALIGEGISLLHMGRLSDSFLVLTRAVEKSRAGDVAGSTDPFRSQIDDRVAAMCQAGRTAAHLGRFQLSREMVLGAIEVAVEIGDPQVRAYAHVMAAEVACIREDFEEAVALAESAVQPALEFGFLQEFAWANMLLSYAKEWIEQNSANRTKCAHLLERYDAVGGVVASTEFRSMLAEMYCAAGELDTVASVLDRAFDMMSRIDESYYHSALLRTRSELAWRRGDNKEAEPTLDRAMEIAAEQGNVVQELKALLTSVSRVNSPRTKLAAQRGRANELLTRIDGPTSGLQSRAKVILGQSKSRKGVGE